MNTKTIEPFLCVGSEGTANSFKLEYRVEDFPRRVWRFYVTSIQDKSINDFFELVLEELESGAARVIMIDNHRVPQYQRKGIAGALLKFARKEIDRVIESSPKQGVTSDIRRTPEADEVWQRLVRENAAIYDQSRDVYMLK